MGRRGPVSVVVDSEVMVAVRGSRIITFFLREGPPTRFASILYSRNGALTAGLRLNVVEVEKENKEIKKGEKRRKRFFRFALIGNGCSPRESRLVVRARETRVFQSLPSRVRQLSKACELASQAIENIALEIIGNS